MTTVAEIFQKLNDNMTPEKAAKINATYLFDIGGDGGGKFFADLTGDGNWITEGEGEAQCTINVPSAEDWVNIVSGKMNPTMAFMQGKLKVQGDVSLAMKLQILLS